jgi:hypothetical protein
MDKDKPEKEIEDIFLAYANLSLKENPENFYNFLR